MLYGERFLLTISCLVLLIEVRGERVSFLFPSLCSVIGLASRSDSSRESCRVCQFLILHDRAKFLFKPCSFCGGRRFPLLWSCNYLPPLFDNSVTWFVALQKVVHIHAVRCVQGYLLVSYTKVAMRAVICLRAVICSQIVVAPMILFHSFLIKISVKWLLVSSIFYRLVRPFFSWFQSCFCLTSCFPPVIVLRPSLARGARISVKWWFVAMILLRSLFALCPVSSRS